ncbi:hypothetical protein BJ742DRAFT_798949 [Cladochytrium replicatum]|nr:hypothetical protein BJ742DRAFT_798949 [Cladochytrium replicatum]
MIYSGDDHSLIPIVSTTLRTKLISEIKILEDVPDFKKDWHPGSDDKVLNLVHPALFPICFGRTCCLSPKQVKEKLGWDHFIGSGRMANLGLPFKKRRDEIDWIKFHVLPSELHVVADCQCTLQSYINNLHPHDHEGLYNTIAEIFGRFVPLFEAVLTDHLHWPYPLQPRVVINSPQEFYEVGVDEFNEWFSLLEFNQIPNPFNVRTPIILNRDVPRPRFHWLNEPDDIMRASLRDRSLQVIVKLDSIHLTPDDPVYPGEAWHVEGMELDAIVATGVYYYDIENITTSKLSFRMAVDEAWINHIDCDREGEHQMYRMNDDGARTKFGAKLKQKRDTAWRFRIYISTKWSLLSFCIRPNPDIERFLCFTWSTRIWKSHQQRLFPSSRWIGIGGKLRRYGMEIRVRVHCRNSHPTCCILSGRSWRECHNQSGRFSR